MKPKKRKKNKNIRATRFENKPIKVAWYDKNWKKETVFGRQRLWNIKPLSVNQVWQGKRFKTEAYKNYEQEVFYKLPKQYEIPEGELCLSLFFGVSSKASDTDNLVKPFQDILSKKYGFNDKMIYKLVVKKQDVKKGEEFIEFFIETL